MKRYAAIFFSFFLGVSAQAQLFTNLVQDPSFEGISGNQPNEDTTPWGAAEGQPASVVTSTTQAHSGDQSVLFAYYYDQSQVHQNLGIQVQEGMAFSVSFWLRYGEQSGNASHTNSFGINAGLRVSEDIDGPWPYEGALSTFNHTPAVEGEWEQFTINFSAATMANYTGQYVRVYFRKTAANSSHRVWLDDVEVMMIPEPMTGGMVLLGALSLLAIRRRLYAD